MMKWNTGAQYDFLLLQLLSCPSYLSLISLSNGFALYAVDKTATIQFLGTLYIYTIVLIRQ